MPSDIALNAVRLASKAAEKRNAFCKFLAPNDVGLTKSHQSGVYIPLQCCEILFDDFTYETRPHGSNPKRDVKILWQDGKTTNSAITYYGASKDEFRITKFGRCFPYLKPQNNGDLFILIRNGESEYQTFILDTEEDINFFLEIFGLEQSETNKIIELHPSLLGIPAHAASLIEQYAAKFRAQFPSTGEMALLAAEIENIVYNHDEYVLTNPDDKLLSRIKVEYRLFQAIENLQYSDAIKKGFDSIDTFVDLASEILNRRKSRAGKSLEYNLTEIFTRNNLQFTPQARTEGKKRPDFIFPSEDAYHDMNFNADKLISLAAKTTCKDRWRQILNEANRLKGRQLFLCTLQPGMSPDQIDEMHEENVTLVIPEKNMEMYPEKKRPLIWTLAKFIRHARNIQKN